MAKYILVDKYGNAYIDPITGEVLTVDVDNLTGTPVESIVGIDTYMADPTELSITSTGITWHDSFALIRDDGVNVAGGTIYNKVPIAAGRNVTFGLDSNDETVEISALIGNNAPWSTGATGSAKLQSAGLYEIKITYNNTNFHSVVYWDGTNSTICSTFKSDPQQGGEFWTMEVSTNGTIYLYGDNPIDDVGGELSSLDLSYRKIGIA